MKTISREHRIYVLQPENEPAITIDDGEELIVESWDAFEGIREPGILQEKSLKGPVRVRSTSMARNPATPCAWNSSASSPRRTRRTW